MRTVVTGGAGFIGSHLVARLRADGWHVNSIDSKTGRSIQAIGGFGPGQADAIFHLASPVGPLGVLEWAGRLVIEVIETTRIVRGWATERGIPLVFVSTSEVYGDPSGPNTERTPRTFQPGHSARMEYAVAKLAAETLLLNTEGLDVRIVRPFNVAGPGQVPDGGFVLPRFIGQALRGDALTVYRPGTQQRAFTHVADIVDGLLLALKRGQPGEAYNLGNPANLCTIEQLAREVVDIVGSGHPVIVDPKDLHGSAFVEAPDKWPDASKAIRELGWQPSRSRRQTIEDAVAHERAAVAA